MDIGLVLEGGGARGAYHIGVTKLLLERKYNIEAVVGTSIGAINAAMIAQNKFKEMYEIWENLEYSHVFDVDDKKLTPVEGKLINLDIVKYISKEISNAFKSGGISTDRIRELLEANIDEDKIRNGKVIFGLVTHCLTDNKTLELFTENIPKGKLIEYILASSRLPGFKQLEIDGKYYIDGGVNNNCPLNMLVDKEYSNIFVVRTGSILRIKNIRKIRKMKEINITYIQPNNKLPNILSFNKVTSNYLLKLGYFDAIKVIDNLEGYNYYINQVEEEKIFEMFSKLDMSVINNIYKLIGKKEENYNSRQVFFEEILPDIFKITSISKDNTYKGYLIAMVEYIAIKKDIDKFKVYNLKELIELVRNTESDKKNKTKMEQVIYKIIESIEI